MIDFNKYNFSDPDNVKQCFEDLARAISGSNSGVQFYDKAITKDDIAKLEHGVPVFDGQNKRIVVKINGELHTTGSLTKIEN